MTDHWMSARDALRYVEAAMGSYDSATKAIIRRACAKMVGATAVRTVIRTANHHPLTDEYSITDNEALPSKFWWEEGLTILDWSAGDFLSRIDNFEVQALGVRFDRKGIEDLISSIGTNNDQNFTERSTKGGAPTKWNWEGALSYLVARANRSDGLYPEGDDEKITASYLAGLLADWFIKSCGNHPSDSELRKRGGAIINEINKFK